MSELLDHLRSALQGRYRVDREVGAGGMATVYLAYDLRLKRRVAIKVLRPDLSMSLAGERFVREVETTANLRHPNILPLFDCGREESTHGSLLYYVMPFIDGESLRQRMDRDGPLPVDDALRIAREVAEALGAAHAAGVIHRDIKPENILLEHGHAIVADFGISRALTAAGTERLTTIGLAIGTPAYMSPEQSLGEDTLDGRSDLYSLGCVLYEMLAGEPPYSGPSAQSIIAKRLSAPIPAVTTVRPSVPPSVASTVGRLLAVTPADRPDSAEELIDALAVPVGPSAGILPATPPRRRRPAVIAALAVALTIVGIGFAGRRFGSAGGGDLPDAEARRIVAVLPFRNVGSPAEQYFADGLTEEVATRISRVTGLAVLAPSASRRYDSDSLPPADIGRRVGAQYLLTGQVQWSSGAGPGARIRVTARLLRAIDAQVVWTETIDAEFADVFAMQERIAARVAGSLGVSLSAGDRDRIARRPTSDPAAYDHVLQGRHLLAERTPEAVEGAIAEYQAALALDPGYADALASLGYAYAMFADWGWAFQGRSSSELRALALEHANRALAADSTSPAAWLTRAYVLVLEDPYRLRGAIDAFDRALQLDSTTSEGWYQYGQALMILGRDSSAIAAYRRAFSLDPDRPMALMSLAAMMRKAGQRATARLLVDSAILSSRTVTSPYVRVMRGIIALEGGDQRLARAEAELALALDSGYAVPARSLLARVLIAEGDTAGAVAEVRRIVRGVDPAAPSPTATLYASAALLAVGREGEALALLERARPRGAQLWFYLRNPEFDGLRSNARFRRVVDEADPTTPRGEQR